MRTNKSITEWYWRPRRYRGIIGVKDENVIFGIGRKESRGELVEIAV